MNCHGGTTRVQNWERRHQSRGGAGGDGEAMGIKGLPEVLKPYLIPVEVSRHKGKRAAVDAYSWLHKGMYGCAYDLGVKNHYWKKQGRDPPYVRYCVHRAQMLRHFGVNPVIVFDGDRLPAKGGEEKERRDRRAECMRKGQEKLSNGDKDGATFFFAQGLDVTPVMAHELIAALKRENFEFVVAPYEADAQIAALAQLGGGEKGGVDIVFTEDSDLVAYGCPTVLFKLDKHGSAMELNVADVLAGPPGSQETRADDATNAADDANDANQRDAEVKNAVPSSAEAEEEDGDVAATFTSGGGSKRTGVAPAKSAKVTSSKNGVKSKRPAKYAPLDFSGWCLTRFLELCVLSGCDFLPNVPTIGIKRAHALMSTHGAAEATLAALRADKRVRVPEDYEAGFRRAFWTFRHARVYDPQQKRLRPLNPLPEALENVSDAETSFLGAPVDDAIAVEVAEGRLDPISRKPFVVPASPQKQRRWAPRDGTGTGTGTGTGGARRGDVPRPMARPTAFANLFSAKTKPEKTPTRYDAGDALDDDAMARMMESVDRGKDTVRNDGGGRELGDASVDGGNNRGSWVLAAFSRAPPSIAVTARPISTGNEDPRCAPSGRASLPANMFARTAPAQKPALGRLAGMFKKIAEKENGRVTGAEPPTTRATPTPGPEPAAAKQSARAAQPAPSCRPRGLMNAFAMLKAEAAETETKRRRLG